VAQEKRGAHSDGLGRDREALEQIEKALSKYPDHVEGWWIAGRLALFLGRDAEAKGHFERLAESDPESLWGRYANIRLGYLLWKAGKGDEARKKLSVSLANLENELGQGSTNPGVPYEIAAIHAVQGENKEACEWLQKAIDAGYMEVPWPSRDPLFEDLHDDARFKKIMAQLQTKADKIRKEIEAME
jgi:tetratricopeptide (TPR) repeat protein